MTQEELDWVNSLMGLPWRSGAAGPDAYDCWGLVQVTQQRLFLRQLPSMPHVDPRDVRAVIREVAQNEHRARWTRVPEPSHGSLVEMTSGRHPYHIGTFLDVDGGGILHSRDPAGVSFDRLEVLRAEGWRRFEYNDWTG